MVDVANDLNNKGKTYKRVPIEQIADQIEAYRKRHNLTQGQMSERLGMSETALSGWLAAGEAPEWTVLALEALNARDNIAPASLYAVNVPAAKEEGFRAMVKAMGLTIANLH